MSECKKCPKCGGDEFYASQTCQGSVTVIVDGNGDWIRNWCEDDGYIVDGLNFDNPDNISELCVKCEDAEDAEIKNE